MFELDTKLKRKLRKEVIDALISFIHENDLIEEIPVYSPYTNYCGLYQYPFESFSAKLHGMQISWYNVVSNVIRPYYIKYLKWNKVYSFLRGRNMRDNKYDPICVHCLFASHYDNNPIFKTRNDELLNKYLRFWVEFIRDVMQMKCSDISHRLCGAYAKRYLRE